MKIPFRFKLIAVAAVLLLVVWHAQTLYNILSIAAIALWVAAAIVLLQVAGLVPGGIVGSIAATVTRVLAPGATRAIPASSGGIAAGAMARPPPQAKQVELRADRREAVTRAMRQLADMTGEDPARQEILEKLVPQARAFAEKKKPLLGAGRALVIVISGPTGVGKSVVARALADILYGLEVVGNPVLTEVPAPTGSRVVPEWTPILEQSLDGIALIDNAAWLLQPHALTGALHADDLFQAVISCANANPGRLALLVTLNDTQLDAVQQRVAFKDLLRKLTVRSLVMTPLQPEALVRILRAQLEHHGLRCPDSLGEPLRRLVKRYCDADNFDHAEAMRRVAESALESNPVTDGRSVSLEELEAAFEFKV